MKKITKNPTPIIIIIPVAVAIVFGYLAYWHTIQNQDSTHATLTNTNTKATTTDSYTYKTVQVGSKTFIEKYKDGVFVETTLAK